MAKRMIIGALLVVILLFSACSIVAVSAKLGNSRPPDVEKKVFIHRAKPENPGKGKPNGEQSFYKLIGAKWQNFPVPLEVNPSNNSGLGEDFVTNAVHVAAEEWDDGAYSGWGGSRSRPF